jgi:hypothetical protein
MGISGVLVLIHYWVKFKILNTNKSDNLQSNLDRLVRTMCNYMFGYRILCYISLAAISISFSFGFLYALLEQTLTMQQWIRGIGILVAILLIFNFLFYWLCMKYLTILYGRYLKDLENSYAELLENNQEN